MNDKWGRMILLCAAVVAWQIYQMASATEEPSQASLILHYVVLGGALIGLVGASDYFARTLDGTLKRPGPPVPAPRAPMPRPQSGTPAAPASAVHPETDYWLMSRQEGLPANDQGVRLGGDRIFWTAGGLDRAEPLGNIVEIHLLAPVFAPTAGAGRFGVPDTVGGGTCRIRFKDGTELTVFISDARGWYDAARVGPYRDFVLELHRRLDPRHRAAIIFGSGCSARRAQASVAVLVLAGIAFAGLLLWGLSQTTNDPTGQGILALLIVLPAAAVLWWGSSALQRNAARRYDPAAIPQDLLPGRTPGLVGAAPRIGPLTRQLFFLGGVGLALAAGLIWTAGVHKTEIIVDPARPPPPAMPQISADEALAKAKEAYRRQDYAEALRGFREAAGQGSAAAQVNLGTLYAFGQGVPQDYAEAVDWFRKAADQGQPEAQFDIAIAYEEGQGVARDYAEALRWYQKAADQGLDRAQNNLARLYHDGQGVARDYAEALRWYRGAADQGYSAAQLHIGTMYVMGQGVAQDYALGLVWYRKAADQGVPAAQYNVGLIYANGLGVTADHAEARLWMEKAAAGGHGQAKAWLEANQPK